MRITSSTIILLGMLLSFLLLATPLRAGQEKFAVLASVNGIPITIMDVLKKTANREARLPFMFKGSELDAQIAKLRAETVEDMIDKMLVFDEFERLGFTIPKDFVEDNLDDLTESMDIRGRDELVKLLNARGETLDELKRQTYKDIAVRALVNDKCCREVFITPKEVDDYYKAHRSEFTIPSEVRIKAVVLRRGGRHSDPEALSARLSASLGARPDGKLFDDAVSLYSEGPATDSGGDIGWIERSKLREDFAAVLSDARRGDMKTVRATEAIYLMLVSEERGPHEKSFAEVKGEIHEKLMEEKRKSNIKSYLDSLKEKAILRRFYAETN